jgi:hypothetical protein
MTRYEYLPNFEPFLVKFTHADDDLIPVGEIRYKIGFQAVNLIEGDDYQWLVKDQNEFISLSLAYIASESSRNVAHFILPNYEDGNNKIFALKLKRDDHEYFEEKLLSVRKDPFVELYTLYANSLLSMAVSYGFADNHFSISTIDKTPFTIKTLSYASEAKFVKPPSLKLLEKMC